MKRFLLVAVLAACPKHGDNPKPVDSRKDAGPNASSHTLDSDGGQALVLPRAPALPVVPKGLPDAANLPRPEDVALGELLFYDARLSTNGKLACATCHDPAKNFSGRNDLTAAGQPNLRRSPSLANLAWATSLAWDGRYATFADLLAPHVKGQLGEELAASLPRVRELPLYAAHFARVGGDDGHGSDAAGSAAESRRGASDAGRASAALAAYVTTRYAGDAPWDRNERDHDRTTPRQHQLESGYALFLGKAQCATCHAPPLYTDHGFHRLGLIAVADDARGKVDPAKRGAFKTPSLRGATLRPAFFHDGSAPTLEAAIDWHLAGGLGQGADPGIVDLKPIALTAAERADLIELVRALTAAEPPATKPAMP